MSSISENALDYCRVRSRRIFDNIDGSFLGTASAVSATELLSCNHSLKLHEKVMIEDCEAGVSLRLPCFDLAFIRTLGVNNEAYFVVSSEGPTPDEQVILYGYRLRDGNISDVVLMEEVGSIGNRQLSPSCESQKVFGFKRRDLIEPGMSGGVVLRAKNFELIGYIAGFDQSEDGERKDDVAICLPSVVERSAEIGSHLNFSYQHRAALANVVRRLLSLSGLMVGSERLGDEAGLEECLVCTQGAGRLKSTLLVLIATSEQMRSAKGLESLMTLASTRADLRGLVFDRAIIVIENGCADYSYLNFVVPIGELVPTTPAFSVSQSDCESKSDSSFIGGSFLSRQVLTSDRDEPIEAVDMVVEAIGQGARCITITGPVGAGKATVLSNLNEVFRQRVLSGDLTTPTIYEARCATEDARENWLIKRGATVIALTDFDDLCVAGESGKALRGLRLLLTHLETHRVQATVVIGMSGGLEQAKLVLSSLVAADPARERDLVVCELLPLDPQLIKQALSAELGSTEGEAWWQTVSSSQEIFQIAQWPCGLAVLLDRVVQAPWAHHRVNQVEVIAALINAFLSNGGCREDDFPPSTPLAFLVAIAKEVNATQSMQVSLERARVLYASLAPKSYHLQLLHSVAVHDILVPGLLSQSVSPTSVSFDSPIFLHYLLAVAIKTSIDEQDLSVSNPMYHRRLPVALLKDVVDLGVDPDPLWKLIDQTKDRAGPDVGFIGGNCISLLRLLAVDFRNRQLADCDLRGGIFAGCDLSGANFENSSLVDVGLANAILDDAKFSGTDLERADLKTGCTVYQLASHGLRVFVATSVKRLVCVDLSESESARIEEIPGFHDAVFSVAVLSSENLVVAGGQDGTLRGWDCTTLEPRFVLRGHFSDVRSVILTNKTIVSGSVDGQINVWNRWSATLLKSYRLCGGQIWSIGIMDDETVTALCDHGHIHLVEISSGKELGKYDLPHGHSRRLSIDHASRRIFVGSEERVWILDLDSRHHHIVRVPHQGVRAIFATDTHGYLLGGSYGRILWTDHTFSTFEDVATEGADYVSDFATCGKDILAGRADGLLLVLKYGPSGWFVSNESINFGPTQIASALRADFRTARNIQIERRSRLAAAGAMI